MRVLMNNEIGGNGWSATVALTEDPDESGWVRYEVVFEMTKKLPCDNDCIGNILRHERVVKQLTRMFRTVTIKRDYKREKGAEPFDYAKVTIVPEPVGEHRDDAMKAFRAFEAVLEIEKMNEER